MPKTALITGGAKRIGKEISIYLAKSGYNIALHYNNSQNEAETLKKEIIKFNVSCELFKADLVNEINYKDLIKNVKDKFPDFCLLINNASIFIRSPIADTDTDLFNRTFNINFKAPYILSRDFAEIIKKGNIINIVDTKISKNQFVYSAYLLSKKCLAEFTFMAANEFAPDIRVNGIAPGLILEPEGENEGYLDKMAEKIPLRKKGNTANIIKAMDFLLNNQFITGEILYIDGGQHL